MQAKLISCMIMVLLLMVPFQVSANQDRSIVRAKDIDHASGKIGTYRALIIGIQNYDDPKISDLKTPLNDARAMAQLLKNKYGFKTTELLDKKATKKAIYNALRKLTNTAKKEDSILIYYAGHGDIDKTFDGGWWIPVDAKGGDPFTYLENTKVQNTMKSIKSRHVLLISDSCYSGTLFGQARAMPKVIDDKYYLNMYNDKSRWGMTSGNKTPVSDSGSDGHSVFAYQLIKKLKRNTKPYISTQEIYTDIAPIVANNSEQLPLCRPVKGTGDMGGEFIFVSRGTATITTPVVIAPQNQAITGSSKGRLSITSNTGEADIFVNNQYKGFSPLDLKNLDPGTYAVRAKLKGYDNINKSVTVNPGKKALVTFYFEKKESKGKLYVTTTPSDSIVKILNSNPRYRDGIELDQGEYKIQVSKSGYKPKTKTIQITSGKGLDLYIELEKEVSSVANPNPDDTWKDPVTGMEFVWVQKGCFQMGSNSGEDYEKPAHEVCLDGFWMGKYEVTQGQWRSVMGRNPSEFQSGDNYPVEMVSWDGTKKFIRKLNRQSGKSFSLPTEAQWEYAARSDGKNEEYAGGDDLDRVAWYSSNSGDKTHQVGTKAPNGLGIYDMSGNIWEWCEDVVDKNAYSKHSRNNPVSTTGSPLRVLRGGSWRSISRRCRAACRYGSGPSRRVSYHGFRLVLLSGQQ